VQTRLAPSNADAATLGVNVPATASLVAIGIAPVDSADLGSVVVRAEVAMTDEDGELEWFDAGAALDLDNATRTGTVPVAGYEGVRLAVRTAADDAGTSIKAFISDPR
jgi:hypothetical protein